MCCRRGVAVVKTGSWDRPAGQGSQNKAGPHCPKAWGVDHRAQVANSEHPIRSPCWGDPQSLASAQCRPARLPATLPDLPAGNALSPKAEGKGCRGPGLRVPAGACPVCARRPPLATLGLPGCVCVLPPQLLRLFSLVLVETLPLGSVVKSCLSLRAPMIETRRVPGVLSAQLPDASGGTGQR